MYLRLDKPSRLDGLLHAYVSGVVQKSRNVRSEGLKRQCVELRLRRQLKVKEGRLLVGCVQVPQDQEGVLGSSDVTAFLGVNEGRRCIRFRGPAPINSVVNWRPRHNDSNAAGARPHVLDHQEWPEASACRPDALLWDLQAVVGAPEALLSRMGACPVGTLLLHRLGGDASQGGVAPDWKEAPFGMLLLL